MATRPAVSALTVTIQVRQCHDPRATAVGPGVWKFPPLTKWLLICHAPADTSTVIASFDGRPSSRSKEASSGCVCT